jgi:Rhomboid family
MATRSWNNAGSDGWFQVGEFNVTTSALVPMVGAISMFIYALNKSLLQYFYFEPELVARGEVWRLATWPIPNPPSIFTVFALYLFYMFGTQIEQILGRIGFMRYLAVCVLVPSVVFSLVYLVVRTIGGSAFTGPTRFLIGPSLVGGIRLLEIALLAIVALEFPQTRFFFGIPARIIALVIIGIDFLQFLGDRLWGPLLFEITVIGVAVLVMKSFGLGRELPSWIPTVTLPSFVTGSTDTSAAVGRKPKPKKARAGKSGGKVVAGPWGEQGTATAAPSAGAASPRNLLNRNDREAVDRLLDKIAASGMASLTAEEKLQLEEASKRLREGGQG